MSQQPSRAAAVDLMWVVPLALFVAAGSRFTNLPEEGVFRSHQPWIALAVGTVAVLGLFASLRWPLPGAATTFGAVALFVVLDLRDGPIYLTLAASAFLVAARVPPRRWARVLLPAGTLLVCMALVVRAIADFQNEQSLWQILAVLAVVAAGAAIGTLTRARALAVVERARAAVTQEQLRMAQDLHDGVGHGLAVIAMHAGVGLHVLDRDPAAARTALEAIRDSSMPNLPVPH